MTRAQCPYCENPLTLEEVSLDHKLCKERHPKPEEMNHIYNLQITHKVCNRMKGNFHHNEFVRLMNVFSDLPEADRVLRQRLRRATAVFGR